MQSFEFFAENCNSFHEPVEWLVLSLPSSKQSTIYSMIITFIDLQLQMSYIGLVGKAQPPHLDSSLKSLQLLRPLQVHFVASGDRDLRQERPNIEQECDSSSTHSQIDLNSFDLNMLYGNID